MKEKEAFALAWELGYSIAIPIVGFALLGRLADQALGTAPWFLLSGLVLSLPITTLILYRKMRKFL